MLKLLLTADYEILGNGSGSINRCLIAPSAKLLQICESTNTRLTFFVDMCEYQAFRQAEDSGVLPSSYTPATWIDNQLKDAIARGHDAQLHIHPQWIEHRYVARDNWEVNLSWWRLPSVPGGYGSADDPTSLLGLLTSGRNSLENLIKPLQPDYECRAFRAGAHCIQPAKRVLQAMRETGLFYDTTVIPGMKLDDGLSYFNFFEAPSHLPYWKIRNSMIESNPHGLIVEVPIFTERIGFFKRLRFHAQKRLHQLRDTPVGCEGKTNRHLITNSIPKRILDSLSIFLPRVKTLDFCRSTMEEMKWFLLKAHKRFQHLTQYDPVPIVAIGHPKGFGNGVELQRFLDWVAKQNFVELESLDEKSFWQSDPAQLKS